ncbi:sodium:solute symporter [Pseudaminobacter arsenicus]|uniref:histidine kinase n=1 Tax=Borborobacter arsenicus TaxID=1851146 RepID=A0A432VCG6_9HYPH|nr:sensor histidine kinase [Pseudaminobacter arsenicus]RUM99867.1 sodium:solute symporter [Pseudaminobacter arsenicus]
MLSANFVILTAVGYVGLLFILAYVSDVRAKRGNVGFLRSPLVYTLSISVYCTSWTFYGAVGTAARDGLEFMAIYLGPTLVFVGWWFILRKLVSISQTLRITSVADLLSSRFGKSSRLAVVVTLIATVNVTPYIALQLKAITTSIQIVSAADGSDGSGLSGLDDISLAFAVAAGMALFTVLFGTRNVDAKEQHHGVVAAIAFEAVVKLLALLAVGLFVVFGLSDGLQDIFSRAQAAGIDIYNSNSSGSRWTAILFLSATAVLCLPRQFQITVVENSNAEHLRTAGWAFPVYLLLVSLFTMPIALYGLATLPAGSNPDMFVLTLPMAAGNDALALFVFIGGFSSATSMIIVASIALSIMVSNHIVLPIALRYSNRLEDAGERGIAHLLLRSRRISIAVILFLGFLYFWLTGDSDALAPIGLISFVGVAQFLPAMMAALYWKEATVKGALAGTLVGFAAWAWTLFLPSFESTSPWIAALMVNGPWGIEALRPEALLGLTGLDPLVHSVFWSLFLNTSLLVSVSLMTRQSVMERIQASLFVDIFKRGTRIQPHFIHGSATTDDLFFVAERVLGWERAHALFEPAHLPRGAATDGLGGVSSEFIGRLERELAGSIGAASAHVLLSKVVAGDKVSLEEVMKIADETQQMIEYSHELEQKSAELRSTAQKLQETNALLHALHRQKDDFLSQVSHEVRTPMTSIRSFSEILLTDANLTDAQRERFASTIYHESMRLTKLLDEILDLSALEQGERGWVNLPIDAEPVLDRAIEVCEALARQNNIRFEVVSRARAGNVLGEADRLSQVLINIIANAIKYNNSPVPVVQIRSWIDEDHYRIEISDNGPGIPDAYRKNIFEKFVRAGSDGWGIKSGSGLGLGLNISYKIVQKLGGRLELVEGSLPGACFRLTLPLHGGERDGPDRAEQGETVAG